MVDLTVKIGNLTLRNPILVGPLVVSEYPEMIEKCLAHEVGGIITPTFTAHEENVFRPRPYIVSPQGLFPDLQDMFLTTAEFSAAPVKKALAKYIPSMRKLCANAGVPLIVSVLADADVDRTVKLAADFASNADALELNTCYLDKEKAGEIAKSVKKGVGIPVVVGTNAWMHNAQSIGVLVQEGVKSISMHTQIAKGILVDAELEEPFAINWPCNVMFGKSMLPISLALVASVTRAHPEAELISIDHATESEDVVQYLLMGARAVSVSFAVQRSGYKHIDNIVDGVKAWMEGKGYKKIEDFLGNVAKRIGEPARAETPFKPPDETGAIFMPVIDTELCKPRECIRCEEYCLHEVFKVIPQEARVEIKDENCYGCGICVGLCPEGAIKLVNRCTEEVVLENRGSARCFK
jgi:dihydroorotate dehydrogenase/Pyruvate/2-oxoacid:ferredoxin oxidoreductase delta subunit